MLGVNPSGRYFQHGPGPQHYNPYPPIQHGRLPSLPYHPTAPFHNQSSVHPTFDERAHSTKPRAGGFNFPHPESSFAELQTFCNRTRQATASLSRPPVHQSQPRKITTFPKPHSYGHCYYDEEEADWFDFGDEIQILEGDSQITEPRFEMFPVPEEPVVPFEQLTVALMDDYEFYCDDKDFIQVYTDGSYINGRFKLIDSVSAIGVWFGPNHKLNVSQPTRLGGYNSDGAELEAIIEAIKIVCSCGVDKVQINTDSKNSVRFVTYFISKWEANGWRNIKGLPVRNQNLIRQLYHYTQLVTIKWNYVPSCGGVHGNVEADRLARIASAACAGKGKRQNLSMKRTSEDPPSRINNRKLRRYCPY
ncbi:ribonuclease H-like isoform X2 [Daphnia pulex]|nr:ribonuclease H-like isoform X2 [Daphnia pulex]XP_046454414.1 ribonuclease H-like isoform X2 [Daphnia pulex]XP_046454415.1 ribonuclease H-like isoform X2 [Daphnia pulex]